MAAPRRSDAAASDLVATVLLLLVVVLIGSTFTTLVAGSLREAPPGATPTLTLGQLQPGATTAALALGGGETLALDQLHVTLQRNLSAAADVPRASWTTPDPTSLRPGDRLVFPLSPALAYEEAIVVRVYRVDLNEMITSLTARAGGGGDGIVSPTLVVLTPTPASVPSDATTTTLIQAQVSHPEGTLAIAGVTVDFGTMGGARALLTLNDAGREGDVRSGDGTWSSLMRIPVNTQAGTYQGIVYMLDASGRRVAGPTYPLVNVVAAVPGDGTGGSGGTGGTGGGSGGTGDGTGGTGDGSGGTGGTGGSDGSGGLIGDFQGNSTGNFTGNSTGNFQGNATGNFTGNSTGTFQGNATGTFQGPSSGNHTGNTTGNHTGPVRGDVDGAFYGVGAGKRATEGTRFKVPTSANVTTLRFENWTYDRRDPSKLDYDGMVVRVLAGERSWSVYLKLDYGQVAPKSVPKVTAMRMWNNFNDTLYEANVVNGATPLNLNALSLNLLDPLGSGQWRSPTGTPHPGALYQNSGITDDPFVVISFLRDERGQGQGTSGQAQETGIYGVDVVFV